ncbi:hypothetical protein QR680_019087 [Steinernema hermaphroditum]|uniref:Uncharacterized protein n=1 Tax=Steinernema hermaphroditum TaxID=289476 RepID=A0AA39LRQ2_9BILA|nr:hypothetical protein QR680_019087 [Steinernema hermaphroditum]
MIPFLKRFIDRLCTKFDFYDRVKEKYNAMTKRDFENEMLFHYYVNNVETTHFKTKSYYYVVFRCRHFRTIIQRVKISEIPLELAQAMETPYLESSLNK